MAALTEDAIAQAKAQHGSADLRLLSSTDDDGEVYEVIVKRPSRAEWKRFRTMQQDEAQRPAALEALLYGCLAHPGPAELGKILEQSPALVEVWGGKLVAAAGLGMEVVEKKL